MILIRLLLLFPLLGSFFPFNSSILHAEERVSYSIDDTYPGPFQENFSKLRWEVPNLIRQTSINVAVRVGLDFQEGWAVPLIIRFVNGSPAGVENALAFVQFDSDGEKSWQTLNINLHAYEREKFNFEKIFAHELLHAMLNDALGFSSVQDIPLWFHEGLAVYGADHGEPMVDSYVKQYKNLADGFFLNGLEGAHGPLDYAEDYLAFKYIHSRHGVTGLQNFIREVVKRKGDIPGALEYTCLETWDAFQQNIKEFSLKEVRDIKRERSLTNPAYKPY